MIWISATFCSRRGGGRLAHQLSSCAFSSTTAGYGANTGAVQQQQTPSMDDKWANTKDYSEIPGPSRFRMLRDFMPGGELHKADYIKIFQVLRKRYGNIFKLHGSLGKDDLVCTYNHNDFAAIYRAEGPYPIRTGLPSFEYYRRVRNPEAFGDILGLVTSQGKDWASMRQKVNPVLMKGPAIRKTLPEIDNICKELTDKIESVRDPTTGLLNADICQVLRMWSFECICFIALDSRLQLLTTRPDKDALRMSEVMADFMEYTYQYDIMPSIWRFYETAGFKHLMRTHDEITELTTKYVEAAMRRIEARGSHTDVPCVLEKLMQIDKKVAVVMAIDLLFGGLDSASASVTNTLYLLATNPQKQAILREELCEVMQTPDTPLTEENCKKLPYTRACIKESLRNKAIVPSTMRHLPRDTVLSGYRVPKGTGIHLNHVEIHNMEEHFPKSDEFIPERWLKTSQRSECPVQVPKAQNPFTYLPFGFGPRACAGKRVAEMKMELVLARLLRRYKVSWTDEQNGLRFVGNLLLKPVGEMKFKFELVDQ